MIDLRQGNCLEMMKDIPSGSIDLVLTDPPYGTIKGLPISSYIKRENRGENATGWDITLPTQDMFNEISRVLRKNGKAVLFSQEPYTSNLINSTVPSMLFCYRAIWLKNNSGNCLMAKNAMVSLFEDICVFINKESHGLLNLCVAKITDCVFKFGFQEFAKIMFKEGRYKDIASARKNLYKKVFIEGCNEYDKNFFDEDMYLYLLAQIEMPYTFEEYFAIRDRYKESTKSIFNLWQGNKSKSNVLQYSKESISYHPTQKPVLLLEDLIKTYSNEGDTVLDFTMGSGSTGVACVNTNRNFIGIELDKTYFDIASKRINEIRIKKQTFNFSIKP